MFISPVYQYAIEFYLLFLFPVKKGDRVAQLVCEKICYPELEEQKVNYKLINLNTNTHSAAHLLGTCSSMVTLNLSRLIIKSLLHSFRHLMTQIVVLEVLDQQDATECPKDNWRGMYILII